MRGFIKKIDENPALRMPLLLLASFLFMLAASVYTTPLNPYYGFDSSVFMAFGKGIAHGMRPYLDLYDNKGPMIFYLNALGWLMGGRNGVFALQVLFMTGTFELIWRLARLYASPAGALWSLLVFAVLYCGTVGEGNMTEEWSLCFALLPVWMGLRYMASDRPLADHPLWYSLVYGLCLGVQLMFRVTNAAMNCGMLLAFAVLLVREKSFAALLKNMAAVLLGAAAVLVPFVVYFRAIGAYDDFVYASLLHNFRYAAGGAAEKTALDWLYWLARVSMVPVSAAVLPSLAKKGRLPRGAALSVCCMGVIGALAVSLGYSYKHYFLLLAPMILAAFAMLWGALEGSEREKKQRRALGAALLVFAAAPFIPQAAVHAGKSILFNAMGYLDKEAASMAEINTYITDNRDSVLGYNTRCRVYLYLDVDPCFRHCMTQEWMMRDSPFIAEEVDAFLRETPPVWVVTTGTDEAVEALLTGRYGYEKVAALDYGLWPALYRRGGEG